MANERKGNRQVTYETLKEDFIQFSGELKLVKRTLEEAVDLEPSEDKFIAIQMLEEDLSKKEKKVDSVLDLVIDLGILAIKSSV